MRTREDYLPWLPAQRERVARMRAEGKPWPEVAAACGHSIGSCKAMLFFLKRREAAGPATEVKSQRLWSPGEIAELERMVAAGVPFNEIDTSLGRPKGGSRTKFQTLQIGRVAHPPEAGLHVRVSAEQIADRDTRRRLEHASLTAAFFNDPLPGHSALDRRQAGIAEPAVFDRRAPRLPSKPTLPAIEQMRSSNA